MVNKLYALIKTHPDGEEELILVHQKEKRVISELQERRWSSIHNTGKNRTDLSIVTFERKRDVPNTTVS